MIFATDIGDSNAVYAAATFRGTIAHGGQVFTSRGGSDVLLVKLANSGGPQWAVQLGGTSDDSVTGVEVDPSWGYVYVDGHFSTDFDVGSYHFVSNGSYDMYLAKLERTSGAVAWARQVGGTGSDVAHGLRVESGIFSPTRVYLAGRFNGTTDFGGGPIASSGTDCVVAQYSGANAFVRTTHIGGSGECTGTKIATAGAELYATGSFTGVVQGLSGNSSTQLVSAGSYDAFLFAYAADGSYRWKQHLSNSGDARGNAIDLDYADKLWVGGAFTGSLLGTASLGSWDGYVARYATGGTFEQVIRMGSAGDDWVYDAVADPIKMEGGVAITGRYQGYTSWPTSLQDQPGHYGDIFLEKEGGTNDILAAYINASGAFEWVEGFGSTVDPASPVECGYSIEIDGFGSYVVGGRFYGSMDVGSYTLTSSGADDAFVFKITP